MKDKQIGKVNASGCSILANNKVLISWLFYAGKDTALCFIITALCKWITLTPKE